MSATGNISTPQFGSVAAGTYDLAANQAYNDDHFRPVRQRQFAQITGYAHDDLRRAGAARQRGDREGAARALNDAARSRRTAQNWSHLNH